MRFFHIITVSEAALKKGLKDRNALELAVGRAVVDLCVGQRNRNGEQELEIGEVREAVADEGLLRYVDEYAERDLAFFATVDGQLRSATDLSDDMLDEGISLLAIYKTHAAGEDAPHP